MGKITGRQKVLFVIDNHYHNDRCILYNSTKVQFIESFRLKMLFCMTFTLLNLLIYFFNLIALLYLLFLTLLYFLCEIKANH